MNTGSVPLLIMEHDIDILCYVTGLTIESVYAATRNTLRNHSEDAAFIILRQKGAAINYSISDGVSSLWSYAFNLNENPTCKEDL
ncbi:hypothetical protein [Alteribacillus sp. YIM 98480]|uniref:Gfo/Idh/MocA family protein n=1 Tax=Alteribacillus sp. YIM 98480 TaxID=2606599 RepID=UPI00131A8176|nr:hypothetical protein [Alteribacillus sp. YIM 98480]